MSGVNKHIIVGRLGKDPELRTLESGNRVATFSMATSESYKDKQTGDKKEITDWHNIVAWNERADNIAKYCKKGDLLYIEGKSRTRSWDGTDGTKKYTTEVIVDQFSFIQPKSNKPPAPDEPYTSAEQQEQGDVPKDDLPF